MPDAGIVIDYNRFLYTRGNPLRYTDPSGNILASVKGGSYPINKETPSAFIQSCQKAAEQAGWSEAKHGKSEDDNNHEADRVRLFDDIVAAHVANPDEPIVFNCFSWAAYNCLVVALWLGEVSIEIDKMIMTGAENAFRWLSHFMGAGPVMVPPNVKSVRYYFAEERQPGEEVLSNLKFDALLNSQNGANQAISMRAGVVASNRSFYKMRLHKAEVENEKDITIPAQHNSIIAAKVGVIWYLNWELINAHANDLRPFTAPGPQSMREGSTFSY